MLALPLVPSPARAQGKSAEGRFGAAEHASLNGMAGILHVPIHP